MKNLVYVLMTFLVLTSCSQEANKSRIVEDFNNDWKFKLINNNKASTIDFDDADWKKLNVPHDWSIELGYSKENTAASTGFVQGGIGWYRKNFKLTSKDKNKLFSILFDGVYNNSKVWINGHLLGERPNGYSSFSYNLTNYLNFDGKDNVIAVKVDRTAYADSRWYTGSGIYRKVQLIKTSPLHIAQWGVKITTPKVSKEFAEVSITSKLKNSKNESLENVTLKYAIIDNNGLKVGESIAELNNSLSNITTIKVNNPKLWGVQSPNMYSLNVEVFQNEKLIDATTEKFGIRTFRFDANNGFFLNGENLKIKGVNLHHDAGAVGTAVPKGIWEYRIDKLQSIGVNAVRMSHNPHSTELMEVCDEKGILVMAEAFDEWYVPKEKSKNYLGDNAAKGGIAKSYPVYFKEWAERDLKDLVLRDFNHPSVIMWSIGNEIEWTFPHYSKTYNDVNGKTGAQGYVNVPIYDEKLVKEAFDKNIDGNDPLATTAKQLVTWVKEVDLSRPVTAGSVLPSIGMASGYGTAVDVFGYNYRAADYDAAHKEYPDLKILGSENWGDYNEWKSINERDFVAGIFTWTGFAYLGEAGPWPRKGLNISFFDYAGFKTPRGHFFECLWITEPKVYMVTTPASESEFSFSEKDGWKYEMQYTPAPVWKMLRKWEWYKTNSKWKYNNNEKIIVQTYTNCEEAELFLNGTSLGKQKLADFSETDNIIKWLVPYTAGELKVVGYNNGVEVEEYELNTTSNVSNIVIEATQTELDSDGYDVTIITAKLLDDEGNLVVDKDQEIEFKISGDVKNLGVDNGWEMNVQPHKSNKIVTHNGKAILILQSNKSKGSVEIEVISNNISSNKLKVEIN
ncbi:sugar-binding domain-containing protein [uncultured Lutibacter sp.]|uniref:sugar-binding domain-containing protein n=1 Tax=uncultured Lutibacter sp. TaxID=437739 RepID=UPI0026080337|nr:sugar-binding domain-containing protein [uncultured Lutibacter sp.]